MSFEGFGGSKFREAPQIDLLAPCTRRDVFLCNIPGLRVRRNALKASNLNSMPCSFCLDLCVGKSNWLSGSFRTVLFLWHWCFLLCEASCRSFLRRSISFVYPIPPLGPKGLTTEKRSSYQRIVSTKRKFP